MDKKTVGFVQAGGGKSTSFSTYSVELAVSSNKMMAVCGKAPNHAKRIWKTPGV